jgi:hypothetical protein
MEAPVLTSPLATPTALTTAAIRVPAFTEPRTSALGESPIDADSDTRWAAWRERGRRADATLQRRGRWCAGIVGAAIVGWAIWGIR